MALDFIAGCLGGCAGVAVGYPFDTVKVRLQTQDFKNPMYRGTWHCLSDTVKKESVRGLYKGMSSPMAGVAVVNAIVFGVHGNMTKHQKNPNSLWSQMMCGATAGFCQSFVSSPMELIKTRVQIQTEASVMSVKSLSTAATSSSTINHCATYSSPLDCLKKICTTEGWRGLFRGQLITVARDVPGFSSYFVTYEYLSRSCAASDGSIPALAVLGAGGFAGAASWVLTYPIDVVKSRLQADGIGGVTKYKGIIHCAKTSIAAEGIGVMFRGLNSSLLRAFPTNAATFAVVTWTLQLCRLREARKDMPQSWREVLEGGEALVKAASVPTSLEPTLNSQTQWQSSLAFLPQVMADSTMGSGMEQEEETSGEPRQCDCGGDYSSVASSVMGRIPELLGNDGMGHNGVWKSRGDILCCTRPSLWALTKHQHNLSIVL
ncbi:mitochondrial basic amino acids transporter [Procambarus clarkii]|uniref:mitochondrial basic amino acids transporter n=1 Tax=Procambarus clarkii TaxID=6728 RepID=UPI001E673286|nr:mitochondrial basic amino acids transporter-like [Procambarus clarkii]